MHERRQASEACKHVGELHLRVPGLRPRQLRVRVRLSGGHRGNVAVALVAGHLNEEKLARGDEEQSALAAQVLVDGACESGSAGGVAVLVRTIVRVNKKMDE
jgi:hypothetical protein